jgi:hypothetical protein
VLACLILGLSLRALSDPTSPILDSPRRLSFAGLGPVSLGVRFVRLESLGYTLTPDDGGPGSQLGHADCASARFVVAQNGNSGSTIQVLLSAGRVIRIGVLEGDVSTLRGIHINSTEAEARMQYGQLLSSFNSVNGQYEGVGHLLVIKSPDERQALVMQTDGQRIVSMYLGSKNQFWIDRKNKNTLYIPRCEDIREVLESNVHGIP